MPHISVPAAELNTRLDRLRCAMTEKDPAWSMLLLDNTLDMYYFTGTMQDGALVVTPDQATLFVRRSFDVAKDESAFADIRPMGSFRGIKEVYPDIPETVYVAAKTMTLQKLSMLNKHLPFAPKPMDGVLSALRSVKSAYELDCMRESGTAMSSRNLLRRSCAKASAKHACAARSAPPSWTAAAWVSRATISRQPRTCSVLPASVKTACVPPHWTAPPAVSAPRPQ